MKLLHIDIPGDPVAKARARTTKTGHTYTPKKTQDAEEVIRKLAREQISEPYDGPVGIAMTFFCATRRRTDGDNLQKLVMDALNKIAFLDDSQVEEWQGRLFRRLEGIEPHTEVLVYSLPRDPDIT